MARAIKLEVPTIHPPKTLVQINGGNLDFFMQVAVTAETFKRGTSYCTNIVFIHPKAKTLVKAVCQSRWLIPITEDKQEEAKELLCTLGKQKAVPLKSLACLQDQGAGREDYHSPNLTTSSASPSLLRLTPTHNLSCDHITLTSPSTQTSETTSPALENSTYSQSPSPAPRPVEPAKEPASTTQNLHSGEKPLDVSASADPNLSLWNSLKDLSTEDFENALEDSEWQGIVTTIRSSYQQRKSEQCISATDYLSCPTLTSCSSSTSRPAGTTKCERWFKELGIVPAGYQLSAQAMALLLGFPEDWFNPLSPPLPNTPVESVPDTSQEEQLRQLKLLSSGEDLFILQDCVATTTLEGVQTPMQLELNCDASDGLDSVAPRDFGHLTEKERSQLIELQAWCADISFRYNEIWKLYSKELGEPDYGRMVEMFPGGSLATDTGEKINNKEASAMDQHTISGTSAAVENLEELIQTENHLMLSDVPIGTSLDVEVLSSAPMTEEEARSTVNQINGLCNQIRVLLVELEVRKGYLALDFKNMSQLMSSSLFTKARSTLQKELLAGRIEAQHLNVPIGTFNESHLRPLSKLKPEHYLDALDKARTLAGDRQIVAKDVSAAVSQMLQTTPLVAKRSIVDVVKERNYIPLTERGEYQELDIVKVRCFKNSDLRPYDGYWGVIDRIGVHSYHVYISLKNETIQCKDEEVERVDIEKRYADDLRSVSDRVKALLSFELEPVDYAILETLQRSLYPTPRQMLFLTRMESDYGVQAFQGVKNDTIV